MSITASEARKGLFPLIKKVNEDHDAIEIVSRHGNAFLVSAEDYAALREGAYLLRSPRLRERLERHKHRRACPARPRRGGRQHPVRLVFEDQGWEDYTSWLKTDRKMLARINKLIEDVRRDPFTGIGKPEPLKYHLPGAWSRRIDDEHRLVYIVTEAEIIILAARYHY
jgi:toxin YoeB